MTRDQGEAEIKEHGPRVLKEYGRAYHAGWCAGIRSASTEE